MGMTTNAYLKTNICYKQVAAGDNEVKDFIKEMRIFADDKDGDQEGSCGWRNPCNQEGYTWHGFTPELSHSIPLP